MTKDIKLTPSQEEAYSLFDVISSNVRSINFLLNYYQPNNVLENEKVFFSKTEKSRNKESNFLYSSIYQYMLLMAYESYHISAQEFEKIIDKFQIKDEPIKILATYFNDALLFDKNEVEFKELLDKAVIEENKIRERKKLPIKDLEEFINIEEEKLVNIFFNKIESYNKNHKIEKLLIYLKKFNIQIPQENYFAQNAATYIYDNSEFWQEYQKHVKINWKDLKIFETHKKIINHRVFNLRTSFDFSHNKNKQWILDSFQTIISNCQYDSLDEKFNHIEYMLIQAKKTGLSDIGKLFFQLVDKLTLEAGEAEKLEEKYLKFAIKENYYIKDIVEISKSIYKKQKTHLFTIDGDYFYTLAIASPKFFNSSFNKLKDDVKLQLLNSNLNGKNIFNQLFCMQDTQYEITNSTREFILNNFDIEKFKNDQSFLKNLLNLPEKQVLIENYYSTSSFEPFNNSDHFFNFCEKNMKIEMDKELENFCQSVSQYNIEELKKFKIAVEKSFPLSNKNSVIRAFTPFFFLNQMNYQEDTMLEKFTESGFDKSHFIFFVYMGDNKQFSQKYFEKICEKCLNICIQETKENQGFYSTLLGPIVQSLKVIEKKGLSLPTPLLKEVQDLLHTYEHDLEKAAYNKQAYGHEILDMFSVVEKQIFNNEINTPKNTEKSKTKFKI